MLKNRFIRDTAWLEAGSLIMVGTYLITSVILARALGPRDLGRYDLAYKFYDLCYFIANLGLINVTVVRYSLASGGRNEEGKVLALAAFVTIYGIMAAAIVALGFFFCPIAGEMIAGDSVVGYYGWALCVMGGIDLFRALFVSTLLGARHMGQVARFESAIALTRVLVLVLAVVGGFGLAGVIYGTILACALSSIMGFRFYFLLRKSSGPERPPALLEVIKAIPRARMRHFFSLGFFIALNKNIMILLTSFATLYMAMESLEGTGHLRLAVILMGGLIMLLGPVSRNRLPALGSELGKSGERDISRMGGSLLKVSLITGVFFIGVTGLFLLAVPWVVPFLYGDAFRESVKIVFILAIGHLVLGFAVIIEPFYIYADRIKTSVRINAVLSCLLLPAGYFAKQYGVLGIASYLAAARFMVIVHFIYIVLYYWRARKKRIAGSLGEEIP